MYKRGELGCIKGDRLRVVENKVLCGLGSGFSAVLKVVSCVDILP